MEWAQLARLLGKIPELLRQNKQNCTQNWLVLKLVGLPELLTAGMTNSGCPEKFLPQIVLPRKFLPFYTLVEWLFPQQN